ncbi:hypothetical protein, partial [Klebsiella pneumoniae]
IAVNPLRTRGKNSGRRLMHFTVNLQFYPGSEMKKARRSEPKTQKAPAFAEALNFFFNGEHTMPIVRTN